MSDDLSAIRALYPAIRERAAEIEQARRLPGDLVVALREAGIFRLLAPRAYGGLEVDYATSATLLRELARADGSVGWTLMIGCETPQILALLPKTTFDDLYAKGPDVIVGGAFAPKGVATPVDGGYRASGQWGFASGCEHADVLFGNCVVEAEDGPPTVRCMLLPREAWTILDTWHTAGLRGTGSHDIAIDDHFIPAEQTFDLFGGTPCLPGPLFAAPLLQFALHIGAVAVGIAEGAVEELTELATTGKKRLYARTSMSDGELFQHRLGHAEADVQAARALLEMRIDDYTRRVAEGRLAPDYQAPVLQTEAWVVETCARAVDTCHRAGGGSAVYESSPLQRRLRDIHTLTQHASAQEGVFANAGAQRLGDPVALGF